MKKLNVHGDAIWQRKDEVEKTIIPLQALYETFAFTSKDMGATKMDAWIYGVVMGWDDDSLNELKVLYSWSDEDVEYQKQLHQNYIKAWNLFMEDQTA